MFQSATVKLTAWYALILVAISLVFSVLIYSIASSEVGTRIGSLQQSARLLYISDQRYFDTLRDAQIHEAETNLIASLIITNIFIWVAGGVGSYYLAKRTLRPIKEAHEAQSRFTSDASHELRTPLASMKTELEVALRDPYLKKDEMYELLKSNLEEVDKLTSLSHTLLQLSKLDLDIKKEKVSLEPTTKAVLDRFKQVTPRIVLKQSPQLTVYANPSNVEQLLTILIDNALKYSPEDSMVTISLVCQKQLAGFEVANEGKGITADILPYIFDRFYQADTSRTGGERKGFGLGLALAKKIVEIHGGELTVSSGKNQTTTFRVLLPISATQKKFSNLT